jgi:hypothetical protein
MPCQGMKSRVVVCRCRSRCVAPIECPPATWCVSGCLGERQLNHALHVIAITQIRRDTRGMAYYYAKRAISVS